MCAGMCGYVCRHAGGRALEWGGHPSERGVPGVVLRCWCGACVRCIGPMRDRFRRQSCGDASARAAAARAACLLLLCAGRGEGVRAAPTRRDLSGNSLTSSIPTELGLLTALTSLCAAPRSRVADGIGDVLVQRGSHAAARTLVCMCCTPMLSMHPWRRMVWCGSFSSGHIRRGWVICAEIMLQSSCLPVVLELSSCLVLGAVPCFVLTMHSHRNALPGISTKISSPETSPLSSFRCTRLLALSAAPTVSFARPRTSARRAICEDRSS